MIRVPSSTRLVALVLALGAGAPALAQAEPDLARQRSEIARLSGMLGDWEGAASMTLPDGSVHEVRQTETVRTALDGTVLVVEGRGTVGEGETETVVHEALGVISFDEAAGAYAFRAYANGRAGTFPLAWTEEGTLVWEIANPYAPIRYTITPGEGTWSEVGERGTPDGAWVPFLTMDLTRVEAGAE